MTPTTAIEVSDLTKRFGSVAAVDDLSFTLDGGVVGILGPNGAGKTTLLRMIATVMTPDGGSVRLCGLDPGRASERIEIRRRLGYLPQETDLYPGFTAYDVVDYVAVLKEITDRDERRAEVRRVLETTDLGDHMHRKVRKLSGGTRRRVALAASLLGRPPIVVLDEPAAGLDPDQRLRLRGVLSEHGRAGTVVVSTHQTDEVAAFCQRVLVMLRGRIRFDGSPAELSRVAEGRVWIDDEVTPGALRSWVNANGEVRHVGAPPPGAEIVTPSVDDGYLMLVADSEVRT